MNRNHLWKLLLILFVVAFSLFVSYPPTGRNILEVFQEESLPTKRDANFTNILQRAQQLEKKTTNRAPFAILKDAVGTNEIARYFPYAVQDEKNPTSAVLYPLQQVAAGN